MNIARILPVLLAFSGPTGTSHEENEKPLKALLIAGGCCHDYKGQHEVLFKGIQKRANVQVDVVWTDDKSVNPPLPIYDDPNWAGGYDIVIHDECAAGNKDLKVMKHVLDAHQTVPSVHLHCAMHSFRNGTDQWFKHLGLRSTGHGPQEPISIEFVDREHPITQPLKNWMTGKEELYNNAEMLDAHPLALGKQIVKRNGEEKEAAAVVVWTNEKQGARSFSTTIGHNTFTVEDERYLDLVTRGLLWAAGKLNDDYLGKPFTGKNTVTFVPAKPKETPAPPKVTLGAAPKDATLVKVTASSEETGKKNYVWRAVDDNRDTRWCASSAEKPQWLQLEFDTPRDLTGAAIVWESQNNAYRHKIEGSADGKSWALLADATGNAKPGDTESLFSAEGIKAVRITCTGTSAGGWASIREVKLKGPGIEKLFPKLNENQQAAATKEAKAANDPYAKSGNIPPRIVKKSAAEEAGILKDVKVPEGFDVTLFSSWEAANYPVYVAAAPNGDLYVSSDGNGSLGRSPDRGRVLRLRDKDGDGRADEVTEFVKNIDSPRGLIWDHDRLYLLHPPHITVFYDEDGDGVAENSKRLIEGIAFGFEGRPADHTTNGLELGIDGWIYIAGGDFGFMKAKGTDGRELQHRGGGVIRFRPDGSGLELFATGTRNILGTPMSPLLDLFARDNTNDGGGWDVRFHHFSGLEDHGYPRLYKNFGDEHVAPLADYGGGSGCGSVYIHEPGFPEEWKNAPFTCDWGTGALWRHSVERTGATFQEITAPRPFIRMTRPTDSDVDGMSRVYQASWKGPATFNWAGPDVGYIARVSPKGYQPEPLPDFEKLSDRELVSMLESPSHIRTLTAQRSLLRRDENPDTTRALLALAGNGEKELAARVAALYAVSQRGIEPGISKKILTGLIELTNGGAAIAPFVARACGDLAIGGDGILLMDLVSRGLVSKDPRMQIETMVMAARLNLKSASPRIASRLGDPDPLVAHTAFRALAMLDGSEACFEVLDEKDSSDAQRHGAALALMRMHSPEVVDGLIRRLENEERPEVRKPMLAALCRLHHREGEWKGDSWGTRPDTRGPFYQPETWEESEKILATLKTTLDRVSSDEAAFIVKEMGRNRIQSDDALKRILTLATENPKIMPDAVAQLATAKTIPAEGVSILIKALGSAQSDHATVASAVGALAKTDSREGCESSLQALDRLAEGVEDLKVKLREAAANPDPVIAKSEGKYARTKLAEAQKQLETATRAFLGAPKLENHHTLIETLAAEKSGNVWADAALLALASRKGGSPESREMTQKAIDAGWVLPERRIRLIQAAALSKSRVIDQRIMVALADTDPAVAKAANEAARALKLQANGKDKTPKIATLAPEKALTAVIQTKGDKTLGEAVFARATCVACHTTTQDQPQKGPYLGNIHEVYKRPDLAVAILDPNKTIAQGFASNVFILKDGTVGMGFVTDEAGDTVTIRDIAAQEHTYKKAEIAKRDTLPTSMMPPGLMNDFTVREVASLLDYLEALAKKN